MHSWEDFLWLFSQPEFIALLLFALAIEPILKFLRRFYPKPLQKIVDDCETFKEELAKNEADSKLMKQSYFYEAMLIFLPALSIFSIYLTYSYFNGNVLSRYFVMDSFASVFAPVMLISIGIVSIKHEAILKHKLKDDYRKYLEIYKKANSIDPYANFIEKNKRIFGYLFIAFGLLAFLTSYSLEK